MIVGTGSVTISKDGEQTRTIQVSGPGLYPILDADRQGRHLLSLQYAAGLRLYTFSFG